MCLRKIAKKNDTGSTCKSSVVSRREEVTLFHLHRLWKRGYYSRQRFTGDFFKTENHKLSNQLLRITRNFKPSSSSSFCKIRGNAFLKQSTMLCFIVIATKNCEFEAWSIFFIYGAEAMLSSRRATTKPCVNAPLIASYLLLGRPSNS